ncbi:hypothetical protein, partial [Sandarakinorhabdus oryzae]|uniref:hypothetical protein n=1 Tax=Sandarakinorhabdus oryzae TaxID=2675220 RepID=UPI0012E1CD3F
MATAGQSCRAEASVCQPGDVAAPAAPRLALFGLPADVAEPVTLLAEILGWQVLPLPPGPALPPPTRACLAMVPAC